MANKAMALSQRQIKALCLGAAQAGFEPEITINGVLIRFVPKGTRPTQVNRTIEDELDEELERFRAKHGYKP